MVYMYRWDVMDNSRQIVSCDSVSVQPYFLPIHPFQPLLITLVVSQLRLVLTQLRLLNSLALSNPFYIAILCLKKSYKNYDVYILKAYTIPVHSRHATPPSLTIIIAPFAFICAINYHEWIDSPHVHMNANRNPLSFTC